MARSVDKSEQITKGSYALGGVWTGSIIIGTIFIGTAYPFPFWWLLIILSVISVILFIIHIRIVSNIMNNIDVEGNCTILTWLCLIQLITLNIPLFAYELIGVLHYRKAFYTL